MWGFCISKQFPLSDYDAPVQRVCSDYNRKLQVFLQVILLTLIRGVGYKITAFSYGKWQLSGRGFMPAYSFQKGLNIYAKVAHLYKCALVIWLSILVASFISGCAASNISKQTQLNANDGILLTKVHSNIGGIWISIYGEGTLGLSKANIADDEYYKIAVFGAMAASTADQPVDYLRVVSIEGGKSYFGYMARFDGSVRLEPQYFNIVPGAINYVGDLQINWVPGWGGYMQVNYVDAEEKTVSEAKERFPWLFDKYRYVKNMPEVKIETVPGFHEVKELKELKDKEKDSKNNAGETDAR
jgi:hypothetical protein